MAGSRWSASGPAGAHHEHSEPLGVDGNGAPTELVMRGGVEVIVHYEDVPDSDITVIDGIPCTTALRTVIDLAPELEIAHVASMVADCLGRGLFTIEEAWMRLSEPDMAARRGAEIVRRFLPPVS